MIFAQDPSGVQGYCYQSGGWSFDCEASLSSLNLTANNWYYFYIVPSSNYDYLGVADGGGTVHWVMAVPDSGVASLAQGQERDEFISFDGSANPYSTSLYSINQYFKNSSGYNGSFYFPTLYAFSGFTGGPYNGTLCSANPPFGEQFYGSREDYTGTGYACS